MRLICVPDKLFWRQARNVKTAESIIPRLPQSFEVRVAPLHSVNSLAVYGLNFVKDHVVCIFLRITHIDLSEGVVLTQKHHVVVGDAVVARHLKR